MKLWESLESVNKILWSDLSLYAILATGVLFTVWSAFSQYRALTHGVRVVRGEYDDKDDPGAINHFQALSTALSATVGLGNIAGVSLAIALGGPGAVFWMWVIGVIGMALKTTEVTLSMLTRNTDDPQNPHGGPMWVAEKGFAGWGLKPIGTIVGGLFVLSLLTMAVTGGNMFQAWNVAEVTRKDFGVPIQLTGIVLAVLVGLVILGGIRRIGAVTGRLVPAMCVIYLLAAVYVVAMNVEDIPRVIGLIFKDAFSGTDATGAFLGGTFGTALMWGMQRALFSSEAGLGSSPIAHSAAKTDEPVREGVVAGLEPFIDTLVVCTLTSMVILMTGAWDRGAEASYKPGDVRIVQAGTDGGAWTIGGEASTRLPPRSETAKRVEGDWTRTAAKTKVFMIVEGDFDNDPATPPTRERIDGQAEYQENVGHVVEWDTVDSAEPPELIDNGVYVGYDGAGLTSHAFNTQVPGFGKYLIVLASWLFAVSTIISWSYYGEQGVVFLLGERGVFPYKIIYCLLILVSCAGFITTDAQLGHLTGFGTGVMLAVNIPITLLFGYKAMKAYHEYMGRLRRGELESDRHDAPSVTEVVEGKDVE